MIPSQKLRCRIPRFDPGGGGINVARAALRMGADAVALFTSGGPTGLRLERLLLGEGIPGRVIPIEGETREDFNVVNESTGEEFRFILPGPRLTEEEVEALLRAIAGPESAPEYVVVSGSLAPGVPDDFYARAARLCRNAGSKLAVNASGAPLRLALDEGVWLMKPSLSELCELTGADLRTEPEWRDACLELVREGRAAAVVLSLGEIGALLASEGKAWRASGIAHQPVSTVGAGDSLLGAMLAALASGQPVEEAFRVGVAAGCASVLTPGTSLFRREDVDHFYKTIALAAM